MEAFCDLAHEIRSHVVTDTRANGQSFLSLDDTAPPWMVDVFHDAHDDRLPDDWKYQFVYDALGIIEDADEDADLDDMGEAIDSSVDVYTSRLLQWLANHVDSVGYVDDTVKEYGWPTDGGLCKVLMRAQYTEREEVYYSVRRSLENRLNDIAAQEIGFLPSGV